MIIETYYINTDPSRALEQLDMSLDELEGLVGRFHSKHDRKGQLKGEIVVYADNSIKVRHHFKKTILWES